MASFALDRLLEFRRAVPVAGRTVNMISELFEHSEESFLSSFFFTPPPSKAFCFYGKCERLCDISVPFCGNPDSIEVSLTAFLPLKENKVELVVSNQKGELVKMTKNHQMMFLRKLGILGDDLLTNLK